MIESFEESRELRDRTDLQVAYIAQVYPSEEVRRACDEQLARRGVLDRKRRWLDLQAECAGAILALTHGGDEDLDPGCFELSDRELVRASRMGGAILAVILCAALGSLLYLDGPVSRGALLGGLLLFLFIRRRR